MRVGGIEGGVLARRERESSRKEGGREILYIETVVLEIKIRKMCENYETSEL